MRKALILLILMTTSCGPTEQDSDLPAVKFTDQATKTVLPDETPRKLSIGELAKAVGPECKTAQRSEYKGAASGQVFYSVQCDSNDFLVGVKMDGSTQVLECGFAGKMGTPCWEPW
jgi:hypothetical protein